MVAILAAIIAAGTGWYTRAQANSARRSAASADTSAEAAVKAAAAAEISADSAEIVAKLEQERAHEEWRPDVRLRFRRWISDNVVAELVITSHSAEPVAAVTVELIGGRTTSGFGDAKPPERVHTITDLEPGVAVPVEFTSQDRRGWPKGMVSFRVTASDGERPWRSQIEHAKLPPGPVTIAAFRPSGS